MRSFVASPARRILFGPWSHSQKDEIITDSHVFFFLVCFFYMYFCECRKVVKHLFSMSGSVWIISNGMWEKINGGGGRVGLVIVLADLLLLLGKGGVWSYSCIGSVLSGFSPCVEWMKGSVILLLWLLNCKHYSFGLSCWVTLMRNAF